MKKIFNYVNLAFVIITIILALIHGEKALSAYFLLGFFQLTTALILLIVKSYQGKLSYEILIYWSLIITYFLIVINIFSNMTIKLLIVPILIAIYHCYMSFKINKP